MKTQGIMFLKFCIMIISFTPGFDCVSQSAPVKNKLAKTVVRPAAKKVQGKSISKKMQSSGSFTGNYIGDHNGNPISLKMVTKGDLVTGTFVMNGEQATLNGAIKNAICLGKITEDNTNITYNFSARKTGENLEFSLLYPGQDVLGVKLALKKTTGSNSQVSVKPASGSSRNPALIGTWRNTEVISSGSGQFYSSFSTDYFVKFHSDGTASIWTGKSAGGTKDVTIDGAENGQVQRMEWYTEGKALIFVDPKTRQKEVISFYAEPNRMMLTGKTSKKVYQRVN